MENIFAVTENLYSSSVPEKESDFATLQKLGIKTIISVDGAAPDAETARKYGMRYVHIPIGYNGTTLTNALRIVKAAKISDGPVLVHCHHGKHRGPAAAALIAQGLHGWSSRQAIAWLRLAGTSPDYPGLFNQVEQFTCPTSEQLSGISTNFQEKATVSGLVDAMVAIDSHWDNLLSFQRAKFRLPANHPDMRPETEAVLLAEAYRELLRSDEIKAPGHDLISPFQAAEKAAWELHAWIKSKPALTTEERARADALFKRMAQQCRDCHKQHRN